MLAALLAVGFMSYYNVMNLQTDNDSLRNTLNNLQASDNQLQKDYQSAQSKLISLQSNYSQLQKSYQSVQSQQGSLQSSYNQLQNDYQGIQAKLTGLQSSYDQLDSRYQQLLDRVPPDKGIQIDSLNWNRGVISQAGINYVIVRNVGSAPVHVISLKLYYNQILQSSANVLVTVSGNSTAKISEFLPPSARSYDYLYTLKIETLEGYTATSDPLPLC